MLVLQLFVALIANILLWIWAVLTFRIAPLLREIRDLLRKTEINSR